MNLFEITIEIHKSQKLLFDIDQEIASGDASKALLARQISERNIQKILQQRFSDLAASKNRPIAKYTLSDSKSHGLDVGEVGSVLLGYRHVYGLTRTSIVTGKAIDTFDHHTPFSLNWGYVDNSVGLTFGMLESSYQKDLFQDQDASLFETVKYIEEMSHCTGKGELRSWVNRIGKGPVKALREWAEAHEDFGSGVNTQWTTPEGETSNELDRSFPQIENLVAILNASSKQEKPKQQQIVGTFIGGFSDTRRFRFVGDNGKSYSGRISKELNEQPKNFPARYKASISTISGQREATGDEFERHTLLDLKPIK